MRALKHEKLKEMFIIVDGHTPLTIVVGFIEAVPTRDPRAALHGS